MPFNDLCCRPRFLELHEVLVRFLSAFRVNQDPVEVKGLAWLGIGRPPRLLGNLCNSSAYQTKYLNGRGPQMRIRYPILPWQQAKTLNPYP
jgi:hypothetical protein